MINSRLKLKNEIFKIVLILVFLGSCSTSRRNTYTSVEVFYVDKEKIISKNINLELSSNKLTSKANKLFVDKSLVDNDDYLEINFFYKKEFKSRIFIKAKDLLKGNQFYFGVIEDFKGELDRINDDDYSSYLMNEAEEYFDVLHFPYYTEAFQKETACKGLRFSYLVLGKDGRGIFTGKDFECSNKYLVSSK